MKTIALYSIKGGVGKTAGCVNLAHLASLQNKKVLIIDLDPQGSTSFYLRIKPHKKFSSEKFLGGDSSKFIRGTDYENLDLLPADFSFRYFDLELDKFKKSTERLKKQLNQFVGEYDLVFLDCPPNITLLSENIFNVADIVLLPLVPTPLSEHAFNMLIKFFDQQGIKKKKLKVYYSMFEKRKKLHLETVKKFMGNKYFLNNFIPYLAEIEYMGSYREPVTAKKINSRGSKHFIQLWDEVNKLI